MLAIARRRLATPRRGDVIPVVMPLLAKAGLASLARNVTHLLYPNHPSRSAGNRHYFYETGSGWVAPASVSAAKLATVAAQSFALLDGVGVLIHFWFSRTLSAGEQTALETLTATLATEYGVDAGDIAWTHSAFALSRTNLVAEWLMVQGATPQRVYNTANASSRGNLLIDSESIANGWGTATRVTKVGAASLSWAAGTPAYIVPADIGTATIQDWIKTYANAAGQYTFTIEARVASGTDTFRLVITNYGSTVYWSPDKTATTDWQEFSFTYDVPGPVSQLVAPGLGQASDGGDHGPIEFRNARFNVGAADLGIDTTPYWDMSLGQKLSADANDPSYSSEGLVCDGTKALRLPGYPGHQYYEDVTHYALFKSNTTPSVADDAQLVTGTSNGIFASLSGPWPGRAEAVKKYAYGAKVINNGLWHVLAVSHNVTTTKIYLDGMLMDSLSSGTAKFVSVHGSFCGTFTSGFPGVVGAMLFYSAVHTDAEVRAASEVLAALAKSRGCTMHRFGHFAAFDGDSLTERNSGVVYSSKYAWIAANAQTPFLFHRNFALSGNTVADRIAAAPTGLDRYVHSAVGGRSLCVLYAGTNDLRNEGASAATVYARIAAYCAARRAAGWDRIAVLNCLPREGAGFNDARNTLNASLAADHSFCDALIDIAADETIGPDAAYADTDYYSDGCHLTAAGHTIVAGYVTPVIAALLA